MKTPPPRALALAACLTALWAFVHYGYGAAVAMFGGEEARWHYVLGAVGAFVLCLMVALATRHWLPAGAALGYGWDEVLKFTCGGIKLYDEGPWITKPGEGLCDSLGFHVYFIGLAVVTFFAVVILLTLKATHEQSPAS